MDKGLFQKEVAEIIKVSEDSITYWENGRSVPQIQYYPAIISFLGYYPFMHETKSIPGKLKQARYCGGYSYHSFAKLLNVDPATVKRLERTKSTVKNHLKVTINGLWAQLPEYLKQYHSE